MTARTGADPDGSVRCPLCAAGPGRQNPVYDEGAATGRFTCEVCRCFYNPACGPVPSSLRHMLSEVEAFLSRHDTGAAEALGLLQRIDGTLNVMILGAGMGLDTFTGGEWQGKTSDGVTALYATAAEACEAARLGMVADIPPTAHRGRQSVIRTPSHPESCGSAPRRTWRPSSALTCPSGQSEPPRDAR
jgi:hypothetical protein